jgi:ppGpp synthetase/RelA/SpoT-type nucleotidyltranferase
MVPDVGSTAGSSPGTKPQTIEEYKLWMKSTLGHDYGAKDSNRYLSNTTTIKTALSQHEFITDLEKELPNWAREYRQENRSDLFMALPDLTLQTKPYNSAIDKSFRINVLWNEQFPEPPKRGWITPVNVYSRLNDLIRTRFVCKFIDGPKFVTRRLEGFCKARAQQCRAYTQGRDEGYYAHHFYATFQLPILDSGWEFLTEAIRLEIQVTTQLQEILGNLTHPYFEKSRIDPRGPDEAWKWETKSNRFRSAYMCHALHLLEAVIVDLREKAIADQVEDKVENDETSSS